MYVPLSISCMQYLQLNQELFDEYGCLKNNSNGFEIATNNCNAIFKHKGGNSYNRFLIYFYLYQLNFSNFISGLHISVTF